MNPDNTPPHDKTDLNILRHLQDDGRLTNAELAQRVNVSTATCHRRTQRLFDEGYIQNVRAIINPQLLNLGTLVMVGVVLDRSTPKSFAEFEAAIMTLEPVLDCDLVAGDFDYLLRIRVKDINDFNQFHAEKLIGLPGVRQARTFFALKEVKSNSPLKF